MKKNLLSATLFVVLFVFGTHAWAQNTTTSTTPAETATISIEAPAFNFGDVKEKGGPITHEFKFTNTGTTPLVINSVKASCGCTTPGWTKEAVQPGGSGVITATYNPLNRPGVFAKTITVSTNGNPPTVVLHINGVVKK